MKNFEKRKKIKGFGKKTKSNETEKNQIPRNKTKNLKNETKKFEKETKKTLVRSFSNIDLELK
jgi:hypothetical protein